MIWKILRIGVLLSLAGLFLLVAMFHTQLGLNYASLEVDNKPAAAPPLSIQSRMQWETEQVPALRRALEEHVFGPVPVGLPSHIVSQRVVDDAYKDNLGVLEEYVLELGEGAGAIRFHLALATPKTASGPAPIIIGQTFCDNISVFEHAGLSQPFRGRSCGDMRADSLMGRIILFVFGEYISKAPMEDYLSRGYAYANFYATEIVPDAGAAGRAVLEEFPENASAKRPTGAVAAWAAGYFAALDMLETDPRISNEDIAVFGHSRHAKSALVAGAWDARIKLVIAHQSGTGGASLSMKKPGETVGQITTSYPHWFDPAYAAYAGRETEMPVDQHALIALNAPRRVLLGNGRRDVWSDPNGAFRAAIAASAAWNMYDKQGLARQEMQDFNPDAEITYHLRLGGHGIIRMDIDAFLAFLDASFT